MVKVKCPSCLKEFEPGEEPDPCLGKLPGVVEACCGHGRPDKGYVMFRNGTLFRGFRKVEKHDLKRGAEKHAARAAKEAGE